MASYTGTNAVRRTIPGFGGHRRVAREGRLASRGGSATTYCYRTSGGTRGTTTDRSAIPAGAEIERTVTT